MAFRETIAWDIIKIFLETLSTAVILYYWNKWAKKKESEDNRRFYFQKYYDFLKTNDYYELIAHIKAIERNFQDIFFHITQHTYIMNPASSSGYDISGSRFSQIIEDYYISIIEQEPNIGAKYPKYDSRKHDHTNKT